MNTVDDYIEFAELVKTLRTAQKNYFATRNVNYLNESKKLEKQVDAVLWPKIEDTQKSLF